MIDISKGKYWGEGITLVDGCTQCSPGCEHCWSAAQAHRFYREGEPGHESGILTDDRGRFNGDILIHPERLKRFNTRKPKVFAIWNDLYHEDVEDSFRHEVYDSIEGQRNTVLILTKRPFQMLEYFKRVKNFWICETVWHGLTVCNQQEADEKIPIFLQVPGKKFLSLEPLLGPINFRWQPYHHQATGETYRQYLERKGSVNEYESLKQIDAIIIGGETGPGARPMHPDWVRSVRDQCQSAGVKFFFKGMLLDKKHKTMYIDGKTHTELPWRSEDAIQRQRNSENEGSGTKKEVDRKASA